MLNNFEVIKNCFGSDDDDEEKFEINKKRDRKITYHPNNQLNYIHLYIFLKTFAFFLHQDFVLI